MLLLNRKGVIKAVNSALTQFINVSISNIEQNHLFEYFCPLDHNPNNSITADSQIYVYASKNKNINNIMRLNINTSPEDQYYWVLLTKEKNWQLDYWEIEESLSRLTNTISATNFGIWEYNIADKEALFSNKFKEIIQINIEQQLSWEMFIDAIYIEDQLLFNNSIKTHVAYLTPLDFEFRMLLDNKIHWFSIKGETFFNDKQPICTMGTLSDCSHRKQIVHELNNAIESNNIAMEISKVGTWYAELNLHNDWIWTWDILTSEMFGFNNKNTGTDDFDKWATCLHPDDEMRVTSTLLNSLETGKVFSESFRAILAGGKISYFIGKGRVRQNENNENYRIDGIFFDETPIQSTQRKLKNLNLKLEERVNERTLELEQAKIKAEKASQIKTEFLSMMSHELRTPMNAVIGSLDLLQSTKQTYEAKDLIDTAKTSAENLC